MTRWIVIFRSHIEGPADVHYVDVRASSVPHAIMVGSVALDDVLGEWVQATALPWPVAARSLDEAVARTGTDS